MKISKRHGLNLIKTLSTKNRHFYTLHSLLIFFPTSTVKQLSSFLIRYSSLSPKRSNLICATRTIQVQLNGQYEVVVTVEEGWYRHRTGDVIKVVGFHNECPILEYGFRYV